MAGRIPQHFIDELISRTDIVELINQRVPLKKAGRNHMACCPFHNEKTPSFNVSQQKQFYHCFGCGANGNALSFLIEYDRLDFLEAVDLLAQHHGLEVPREGGGLAQRGPDHKPLYAAMDKAAEYYQRQLRGAEQVVGYLKRRKISGETAKRFGIGYAPQGWENINLAVDATGGQHKNLIITGMLIERDEPQEGRSPAYDRFRDRVMFPIRDARGRTIAFGGRVLGDEKPKYLNSPETPIFHKGKELYGLYEMKQLSESFDHVLVVEGYMDVVALAEHGVNNAVATLGTATSADHLQRLYRSFGEIVFCFDGDAAGKKAAWRALETVLPLLQQTRQARFLFLPDGEDPDSLVQSVGAEVFRQRVKAALPMSAYLLDTLELDCDMVSLDGRAKFAEVAKGYVNKMPNGVFKELLAKEVAKRSGVDEEKVTPVTPAPKKYQVNEPAYTDFRQRDQRSWGDQRGGRNQKPARQGVNAVGARNISTVTRAIRLLVNNPSLGQYAPPPSEFSHVQDPNVGVLIAMLEYCQNHPSSYPSQVAERWRDTESAQLVLQALMHSLELDAAMQEQEFSQCVEKLLGRKQISRLDFLLDLSRREPLSAEQKNELKELLSANSQ